MLNTGFNLGISQLDLVKIGQKCENNYDGVNSGIMDQFAVGMGKKDQAILLDTNTMDYSESVKSFTYNNALSLALIKAVMNINSTLQLFKKIWI